MPEHLGRFARQLWRFILEDLGKANVIRHLDSVALGECCQWYERYRRCAEELDAGQPSDENAYKLTIQTNLCWKSFEAIASQFGLTPATRMRLRVEPDRKPLIERRQRPGAKQAGR